MWLASHPGGGGGGAGIKHALSSIMLQKPGYAPAWWAKWLVCRLNLPWPGERQRQDWRCHCSWGERGEREKKNDAIGYLVLLSFVMMFWSCSIAVFVFLEESLPSVKWKMGLNVGISQRSHPCPSPTLLISSFPSRPFPAVAATSLWIKYPSLDLVLVTFQGDTVWLPFSFVFTLINLGWCWHSVEVF